jgi:hypothetical protein
MSLPYLTCPCCFEANQANWLTAMPTSRKQIATGIRPLHAHWRLCIHRDVS